MQICYQLDKWPIQISLWYSGKYSSSLTLNGIIMAHGPKVGNLFTYVTSPIPADKAETARISTEPFLQCYYILIIIPKIR